MEKWNWKKRNKKRKKLKLKNKMKLIKLELKKNRTLRKSEDLCNKRMPSPVLMKMKKAKVLNQLIKSNLRLVVPSSTELPRVKERTRPTSHSNKRSWTPLTSLSLKKLSSSWTTTSKNSNSLRRQKMVSLLISSRTLGRRLRDRRELIIRRFRPRLENKTRKLSLSREPLKRTPDKLRNSENLWCVPSPNLQSKRLKLKRRF
jgi:hypothetical protein